ncbi:MAG: CHASE3 domain-containing protein [Ktedonobacteraceae bacterium]|nr:CHASE3 domain-containing protein [Ktedonobacteraceae bacterium]
MASSSQELPHPRLLYAIRIWLIVIVSLLFLLNICGGLLELLLEDYQNEMERTTIMTAHDLDTLLSSMIDQETGLRGYITTTDPNFLEPFYQGREAYIDTMPHLKILLQKGFFENTRGAFSHFYSLTEQWYNTFAVQQIHLMHTKNYIEARSLKDALIGKAIFDKFRAATRELENIINEDSNVLRQTIRIFKTATIITVISATLFLLSLIWLIAQRNFNMIGKQLKILLTTMATYKQGEYHIRMQSMRHKEFQIFAQGFNDMMAIIERQQHKLQHSEQNFRSLADALPQIVWTANPDGNLDYYNQKWFDYTGMTLEQTQSWGWEPVLHPDDLQKCVDVWTQAFTTGESYQTEYRFKRASDGMYRWHLGRALPQRDATGTIIKWFGTGTDIEDLKEAEQMLIQAIQDQHNFVSTVGHEFRTALTSIQGFSELLSAEDFEQEQVKEYAQDIHTDACRLHRMIDDLLDLEKMESGRVLLEAEDLDFIQLTKEVVERMNTISSEHEIEFMHDKNLPQIQGDKDKLTQILYNLLSNALKYSPQGGKVLLEANVENAQIHVCVEDQGIGIPKEALEAIFHPYNRVHAKDMRYIKGTGLGLPIVRRLVELHEGHIWAESVQGQGSTFHFILPIKKTARLIH